MDCVFSEKPSPSALSRENREVGGPSVGKGTTSAGEGRSPGSGIWEGRRAGDLGLTPGALGVCLCFNQSQELEDPPGNLGITVPSGLQCCSQGLCVCM